MENKVEISKDDLINAGGLYKAKEAGYYGNEKTEAVEIGNMAGVMTDVKEAEVLYQSNEIPRDDYVSRMKNAIFAGAIMFIDRAIERGLDVVQTIVAQYVPVLVPVVGAARTFVKNVIMKGVVKVAEKAGSLLKWIKEKIFS